jgi:hypothetical protein
MIPNNFSDALGVCRGMSMISAVAPWYSPWNYWGYYNIGIVVVTLVSAGIIGIQMRKRIRKDLGRKATEEDLTSIDTWMKVDEVEHPDKDGKVNDK